ncbi:hypothetical protein [Pontiella sulfatireligans]|uniref:Cytoplasmic protein n=1 Tax=Pontiella sulfatireligans TaxID=2750658 RepID=A0A6C2UMP8_9BACT|nr:hypothetical protein [Pontiella sulfatireligans]VGO21203.1 hypothetical protein SCARR_03275 [Pontiella sulfatireligans]
MSEETGLENIKIDGSNLWKEENFTDLQVGSIRKLTPIKLDGTEDEARTASYSATTNIMTPSGALPISGEIEATNLEEAVEKFPAAINAAVKKLQDDMIRMQQEQASQIVTPDQLRGGKNDIII